MIEILQKWGKAIAFYLVPINVFLLPPMIGVRCELVVLQVRMIFFFFLQICNMMKMMMKSPQIYGKRLAGL